MRLTMRIALAAVAAACTAQAELRINEICARCQPTVPAQKDLGWIELFNDGEESVNLKDYKIVGTNRGKAVKSSDKDMSNLLDREVAPGAYTLVYTSEMFPNGDDGKVVAAYDYGSFGTIMVVPKKINQKKYPMVQLYRGADLLQTVCVPVDLADEKTYTTVPSRLILDAATPGRANGASGVPYGPNVSCLYGVKDAPAPWKAFPPAKKGADYTVRLPVNPIDLSAADDDRIASVRLVYRLAPGGAVTVGAAMRPVETNKADGVIWEGTIPGAALTASGQLVQFAVQITDGAGRTFRSPSFCNPDDGYEWYGTVVNPNLLDSKTLQTFHLFAEGASLEQMDVDADSQDRTKVPYNARCGIYDATTGLYYDNVRIDLRGNTSAAFKKKSHGLRFNKSQPLTCVDPVTGTEVAEIRKSSFVAEYADPSVVRQYLSFKVFREMGLNVPFHYPVRLNLNGSFFQFAYHSERFTDELIEDCYGLDPLGYSYKNVGTFGGSTMSGGSEKKTPDDERENDLSVLNAFCSTFREADAITESFSGDGMATEIPSVTRTVVRSFDLPAWLNYMAVSRVTHEADDVWANICAYYDVNGTGTWMPLAYDLQMSFGQYYWNGDGLAPGTIADADWYKSHPFYGGYRVRCHTTSAATSVVGEGNRAFEAVWQSPKFRRLFLRRLRTVMDAVLKEPGTPKDRTPFWRDAQSVRKATSTEVAIDQAFWTPGGADWTCAVNQPMYDWRSWMSVDAALDDLWRNYVEKRRVHLYVTHSATNTAKAVGYGRTLNAGIPPAQSPIAALKGGFSFGLDAATGLPGADALEIRNANDEAVDLSGWTLSGSVEWTLPPGTVVDAHDALVVVADRRAYVTAHAGTLTDQVIVGNAAFGRVTETPLTLADAEGNEVVGFVPPPVLDVGDASSTPGTDYQGARVELALGEDFQPKGREVTAVLELPGLDAPVAGTVDLEGRTVAFEVDAAYAEAAKTAVGKITLAVGDERLEREIVLVQGTMVVTGGSEGWIRVGPTDVEDGLEVRPQPDAPSRARVTLKARLPFGGSASFAADAHAGIRVASVGGVDRYVFRAGADEVTNLTAVAVGGREIEVEIVVDYRLRTVAYAVDGEACGTFALGGQVAADLVAREVDLVGGGHLAYLAGEYEETDVNTNLAAVGGTEYPTVAAAVADGGGKGPVRLLWDASWAPTAGGSTTFVTGGHRLVLTGGRAARVVDNGDGTLTVTVEGEEPDAPESASIVIEGGRIRIGVVDPQPGLVYGVSRATELGADADFRLDETSLKSGEDLLSGKTLEVEKDPSRSVEFFKIVIRTE